MKNEKWIKILNDAGAVEVLCFIIKKDRGRAVLH